MFMFVKLKEQHLNLDIALFAQQRNYNQTEQVITYMENSSIIKRSRSNSYHTVKTRAMETTRNR